MIIYKDIGNKIGVQLAWENANEDEGEEKGIKETAAVYHYVINKDVKE